MNSSTTTFSYDIRLMLLFTLVVTLMSWSGCKGIVVIPADQVETAVSRGVPFVPQENGWYMTDARYLRYRKAVADKIQELSKP